MIYYSATSEQQIIGELIACKTPEIDSTGADFNLPEEPLIVVCDDSKKLIENSISIKMS
jgi:hypothetical protein